MTHTTQQQFDGSLAKSQSATAIDIKPLITVTETSSPSKKDSDYTSRGVKKATASDPIRNPGDIKRIADYLETHGKTTWYGLRNRMAFVLGVTTGLRASDLLKLRIRDVIRDDGTFVDHLLIREKKTKKTNDPKLGEEAQRSIYKFLSERKDWTPDDYLIRTERGGKMSSNQFYDIISSTQEALKLPYHIGTHTMRKTYGYWTIRNNPNDSMALTHLQHMFNHTSMQTTLTYCGISRDEEDKYYDSMNEMFE